MRALARGGRHNAFGVLLPSVLKLSRETALQVDILTSYRCILYIPFAYKSNKTLIHTEMTKDPLLLTESRRRMP